MILSPSIPLLSITLLFVSLVTIEAAISIYAIREPHIESIKKGKEICDYYNKEWFPCFDSPYFSAHCIFSPITGYSIVTAVRLKFINKNSKPNIETYTATDSNVQQNTKFDSGATQLFDIDGKPWLDLIDDQGSIIIKDYNTGTIVQIQPSGGLYNLYIKLQDDTAKSGTGLLVDGCPKGFLNPNSGRRKRSTSECDGLPASNDETFDEKTIRTICEHDIKFDRETPIKLRQDVEAINRFYEIHQRFLEELKEIKAKN